MIKLDAVKFHELTKKENRSTEMALNMAKAAISAARTTPTMNDTECEAYLQAVYFAYKRFEELDDKRIDAYFGLDDKMSDTKSKQEYDKICKEQDNAEIVGTNLFKQALLRQPTDEQLRFICAGIIANKGECYDLTYLSCVKVLEDIDIARDLTLSTKIMDAAMQWKRAYNNSDSDNEANIDIRVAKAFFIKNFSSKVMINAFSPKESPDTHPSYERGAFLFEKLEQRIKNSKLHYKSVADETMGCLGDMDEYVLESAFKNSPRLAKAYANLLQSFNDAYVREAKANLEHAPSYKIYESAVSKKSKNNSLANEGRQ